MTLFYHLVVGNSALQPTDDDLVKVVAEFKKDMPVFDMPVKVRLIEVHVGMRLCVQCGDLVWTPSPEELKAIRALFTEASDGSVVATRSGVNVNVVPILLKG